MTSIYTMTDQQRQRDITRSGMTLAVAMVVCALMLAVAGVSITEGIVCTVLLGLVVAGGIGAMYARHRALAAAAVGTLTSQAGHAAARVAQTTAQAVDAVEHAAQYMTYQIIARTRSREREQIIASREITQVGVIHACIHPSRTVMERAAAG